jgi:transmembrane sensor
MKPDQEYSKKISAYLAGHLSAEERKALEQWIAASPENKVIFNDAKKIWDNSGLMLRYPDHDTETDWRDLQKKIQDDRRRIFPFPSGMFLRIAAGIALVAGITYTFFKVDPRNTRRQIDLASRMVAVISGDSVMSFFLPDSSQVWLNAHSVLKYPENYAANKREATLQGEGFFQVKHDEQHPFVVTVRNAAIQVLGTSFNIREDSAAVTLTVAEGTVRMTNNESVDNSAVVKDNERAVMKTDGRIEQSKNTDPQFEAWRRSKASLEKEKSHPKNFLSTHFKWRKNQINQSVIEGTLKNTASSVDYKNIILRVTYKKPNGKMHTVHIKIPETVHAGETVNYQKRLFDILTDTKNLEVEIEKADTQTSVHH